MANTRQGWNWHPNVAAVCGIPLLPLSIYLITVLDPHPPIAALFFLGGVVWLCLAYVLLVAPPWFRDWPDRKQRAWSISSTLIVCALWFAVLFYGEKTRGPDIHSEIAKFNIGRSYAGMGPVEVSMWVLVQNRGPGAVAIDDWSLLLRSKSGITLHPELEKHEGRDLYLQVGPNLISTPSGEVIPTTVYPPESQLWTFAYTHPISAGSPGRGYLAFTVPDAPAIDEIDAMSARLKFIDSNGETWFSDTLSSRALNNETQSGEPFPEDMVLGNKPVSKMHKGLRKIISYGGPNTWIHIIMPFSVRWGVK